MQGKKKAKAEEAVCSLQSAISSCQSALGSGQFSVCSLQGWAILRFFTKNHTYWSQNKLGRIIWRQKILKIIDFKQLIYALFLQCFYLFHGGGAGGNWTPVQIKLTSVFYMLICRSGFKMVSGTATTRSHPIPFDCRPWVRTSPWLSLHFMVCVRFCSRNQTVAQRQANYLELGCHSERTIADCWSIIIW